ncbi:hypothetical protein QA802_32415 [Streptomyces sp. B21-105]
MRAQFERRADGVGDVQGTTLVRDVDPLGGQPPLTEPGVREVEVLVEEHPEADPPAGAPAFLVDFQDEAVVAGFGQPAQVAGAVVLVADDEPQRFRVEVAARGQVGDGEPDMAGAGDVERRAQIDGWQHAGLRAPIGS